MHVAASLQVHVVPAALPPMEQVWSTPGCCTVICPLATRPFWKLSMELESREAGSATCGTHHVQCTREVRVTVAAAVSSDSHSQA